MTANPPRKTRLEIFVSYAREDALLVRDITDDLKETFGVLLEFFVDSQTINQGADYRKVINDHLDSADVLLIIATGRLKESYDFPGYEVGYFDRSIKGRSTLDDGTGRHIIPLIIGGATPTAVLNIQGVIIQPNDVLSFELVPGDLSSEAKFLQGLKLDNPFRRMLLQLRDNVTTGSSIHLSSDELRALDQKIEDCAARIYKKVFVYLQGRVSTETFPERKLIVRTALAPLPADEDAILAKSTIEFVGRSFDVFGLPERPQPLTWSGFTTKISQSDIGRQWKEGIRTLVSGALSGMPADNYYYISPLQVEDSFRLFVSLTRTYNSGQREIHIYIVKIPPLKDYGDLKTTKLMKAVGVGLRYRSLFLETHSPFSAEVMWWTSVDAFQPTVKELWNELQRILADAKQARLDDPQLLLFIYGPGGHEKLDRLAAIWEEAEQNLNKMTHQIMAAEDAKIAAMKPAFMAALQHFCEKTEEMNREFTAKALQALEAEISRTLAVPAAGTPGVAKAATA